jgi:hypothetical protein
MSACDQLLSEHVDSLVMIIPLFMLLTDLLK